MSITKLPSGHWRAQVYDSATKKNVSVGGVLGGSGTFTTKREAKAAREQARQKLRTSPTKTMTVDEFHVRWTSDPLFARPKESTNIHNRERTKAFAEHYASLRLAEVDDEIVADWLAGGRRNGQVPALRAMFNDAASAKAGRLLERNPFASLRLKKTKGNALTLPPSEAEMGELIRLARKLTPPSFAGYLEVACHTGARPGELDALRRSSIDFEAAEIAIVEQWNAKTGSFTLPKYGPYTLALVEPARQALLSIPRDEAAAASPFVFCTNRGTHYTPSSRTHHWNRVRAAAGLGDMTFYVATRHYFGWYATNVLELPSDIVALQLGHKDGGKLVSQLYGHLEGKVARRRIRDAYTSTEHVNRLQLVRKEAG